MKTYAYWAQYDASKWALIPDLADKIKNEGARALITGKGSPAANYQAVFTIDNNWTSEYIWSVNSGIQGGSIFPGVALENKGWGIFNGWGYFQPTEELYEEYEAKDPRREVTIRLVGVPRSRGFTNRMFVSAATSQETVSPSATCWISSPGPRMIWVAVRKVPTIR